jgi:hypothetical protein
VTGSLVEIKSPHQMGICQIPKVLSYRELSHEGTVYTPGRWSDIPLFKG